MEALLRLLAASEATPPAPRSSRKSVVLVVDDERINRTLIAGILKSSFEVLEAASGLEAVESTARTVVDAVVMDIHMPGMNGFEATQRIKELAGDRFLPVIMMTAGNNEALLGQGLARGADDFLIKPISRVLLREKIRALLRVSAVVRSLREQNLELASRRTGAERDYDMARRVFERATRRSRFDLPGLIVEAMSLKQLSSDFVLSILAGHKLRLLVGDFGGHGLGAAVGILPASEVFYEMTEQDLGLAPLVRQLATKVNRVFPRDLSLSCCLVDVDLAHGRISLWNAGLPDVLIFGADGTLSHRLSSRNLPLGILPPHDVDSTAVEVPFPMGSRLAILSDGLLESRSPEGELFGSERVEQALTAQDPAHKWSSHLFELHRAFCLGTTPGDDATFVGLTHTRELAAVLVAPTETDRKRAEPRPETCLSFRFVPETLRSQEPLNPVLRFLTASSVLAPRAAELQLVVAELFANAVEHGLLGLSSAIKEGSGGFQEYYSRKEAGLGDLKTGAVNIGIEISQRDSRPHAIITVSDTGAGFSPEAVGPCGLYAKAGRGLLLVRSLAREVTFLDQGRSVEVVMDLTPPE